MEKKGFGCYEREVVCLVGAKLVPVLSRKDVFEAHIGPFVNDCAKTSMVTSLLYFIYLKNI